MTHVIRVLELRCVWGTGGGPEKTILLGATRRDSRFVVTVCYLRHANDSVFSIGDRARGMGIDYVEICERHSLDPAILTALRRLVRERNVDIIHAHDYKTNLLALLVARSDGVRVMATAHGWTGRALRERWCYYPLDKRLLARFPLVVAVSREIRDELVRAGAPSDRVRTLLNGIDPGAFKRDRALERDARSALGLSPSDVVVGAVGRLEQQKRFDWLIHAFTEVWRDRPQLRLVIGGDGSLRPSLEALARKVLPEGVCRFLGHRADVVQLHHAFDVFAQSSDYEGTPNAVLEAMALETPVVATDVGGTGQLLHDGVHGLLVPAEDRQGFAEAIIRTFDDAAATAARVRAARERVERELSFDARARTLESIYEELVDTRGQQACGRRSAWVTSLGGR